MEMKSGSSQNLAIKEAQTMAVTSIILFQVFYLFQCRSIKNKISKGGFFSNRFIFIGVGTVLLAQVAFVYWPLLNRMFQSARLNAESWAVATFATFLIVPLTWGFNLMGRYFLRRRSY